MIFYQRYDDPSIGEDGLEGRVASKLRAEEAESDLCICQIPYTARSNQEPSREETTILWWNSDARVQLGFRSLPGTGKAADP